ncbi:MAG: HD domain-containing protein, partial [Brachymonas sp.]|nr:HD domain-containing protein [Brachymonas sp.]
MKTADSTLAPASDQATCALAPALLVAAQGFSADDLARDEGAGRALARARGFAEPLIAHETLDTGENILAHADAVADILRSIGGSEAMQAASYLVYAGEHLNKPQEVIERAFGASFATLALETTRLVQI